MDLKKKKKVVLFGAGDTLTKYLFMLEKCFDIQCICDNDKVKQGGCIIGRIKQYSIVDIKDLLNKFETEIWIVSLYWKDISEQLYKEGFTNVHAVFSDYPLKSDYSHCKMLFDTLWKKQKDKIGNRVDCDWVKRTWEIYDEWSNHYRSHNYLEMAKKYGILKQGDSFLDYGFGMGTMVLNGIFQGYDARGVEVENWKWDYIRLKIKELDYPEDWGKRFVLYSGEKLPFEDESFDAVFSWFVMEHTKSVKESLSEMIRVTKKGGTVMFDCPNYDSSYDDHFYLDIGMPLKEHSDELKRKVESYYADSHMINDINFINKKDIYDVLSCFSNIDIKVQDLDLNSKLRNQNMRFVIKKE